MKSKHPLRALPDGSRVLFYASKTPEGYHGDLIVRERATGKESVIAKTRTASTKAIGLNSTLRR